MQSYLDWEKHALPPKGAIQFRVGVAGTIPEGANEMIFTVSKAGRIQNARWTFPITR